MLTYDELLNQVQHLTPDEQLKLLQEVAMIVRRQFASKPGRSIKELRGLGKEVWEGIDAQEYVNQERNSWAG
ncbi:MAG: hypothetical protein KIT87_27340 [Anaerolineae bacterium]|nr:hypothetical protein [Anaerolineae bacterium]